jgi:hypothetical protein
MIEDAEAILALQRLAYQSEAATLSARPPDGFGEAACPGKVFIGGKLVRNGQGIISSLRFR